MSYILDALKKLEQKRQQEGTLTILALQSPFPAKSKPRRVWLYVVLSVLILNGGAILWWMSPWKSAAKNVPVPMRNPVLSPATDSIKSAAPPFTPPSAHETKAAAVHVEDAKIPPREREGKGSRETSPPSQKSARASEHKPSTVSNFVPIELAYPESTVQPELKPPKNGKIHRLADLPASVSSSIPELKISLHYYIDDPKARFARINDKTMREGQYLAEGLKVDEINASGVIMNCRGWRFLLEISNEK
ncbi:MAG: general secretion pathway protein GspB [Syntrophobacterales bacterium]|jgi:hypothetical protein|nr:general secretion pathway protein GspB [Syntrophobacterales bacterium]